MAEVGEKEILNLIEQALDVQAGTITPITTADDIAEWDSLGHLSIIACLDKFFNGRAAKIKDLATADSVQKILQSLKDNALL